MTDWPDNMPTPSLVDELADEPTQPHDPLNIGVTAMADIDQILEDVAALQDASAAAADQIADLTDRVLELTAGNITDDQLEALHNALAAVTHELVAAVEASDEALADAGAEPVDAPEVGPDAT